VLQATGDVAIVGAGLWQFTVYTGVECLKPDTASLHRTWEGCEEMLLGASLINHFDKSFY